MSASLGVRLVHYFSGGVLSALLGLLSFSLLTRSLTVDDYGLLGLVTSTVAIFVAVGKWGLQHGVMRFYAEQQQAERFIRQTLKVFLALACLTAALWWLAYGALHWPPYRASHQTLFAIATLSVFVRLYSSAYINVLKARHESAPVLWAQSIEKLSRFALIFLLFALGLLDAASAMATAVLSELLTLYYLQRPLRPVLAHPARASEQPHYPFKAMLLFSLPMMLRESLGLVLEVGDRYVIDFALGSYWLGQYAVPYNLALYLDWVMITALASAVVPQYVNQWERESPEVARAFINRGLCLYCLLSVGIWGGFVLEGQRLITLLAGERYHAGDLVLIWVVAGILVQGATVFTGAGLYLAKKSQHFMTWNLLAGVINLGLNWLLVPHYGIQAAAIATLVCYSIGCLGISWRASAYCRLQWPWRALGVGALALGVAYGLAAKISLPSPIATLAVSGGVFVAIYAGLIVLLHPVARREAMSLWGKVRRPC